MERRAQDRALKEWDELQSAVVALDRFIREVYLRATYSSGIRKNIRQKRDDKEVGTPKPYYDDPTGEMAIKHEAIDTVAASAHAMSEHIFNALNIAKEIIDITPSDVAERAKRQVPDCMACGKPVEGRILSGYDEACYKQWQREGYPDRVNYQHRRAAFVEQKDQELEWRIEAIDTLQTTGNLPLPSAK